MIRAPSPEAVCKRLEVLHDCREVELVASTAEASQSHALETMMRLQVGKTHLYFLAIVTRFVERCGAVKCTGLIASIFIDVARDIALWGFWTALGLERTGPAIIGAREVASCVVR